MPALLLKTLILIFCAYILFVGYLYLNQRNFMYFPNKTPVTAVEGAQLIRVKTQDDLALQGLYFAPSRESAPVILYFHGNAGSIIDRLHKLPKLLEAGYGVLLAEYRGYGGNAGEITEDGLYKDADAYFKWLIESGVGEERIVLFGESLGTGVAVELATKQIIAALILETPYAAITDAAKHHYPYVPGIDYLMHDHYRSIDKIEKVKVPKLFIIAGQDEVLGTETGMRLYEAAGEPKDLSFIAHAHHNDSFQRGGKDAALKFLSDLEEQGVFKAATSD